MYIGIENLLMNTNQKITLVNALKEVGCDIYDTIRNSPLEQEQKDAIIDALHTRFHKSEVVRLVKKIDRQQALFENEEIEAPAPDMTPLTSAEKQALSNLLDNMEPSSQPFKINHWRVRPDGNAVILVGDLNITANNVKSFLANMFNVAFADISYSTNKVTLVELETPIATYAYGGQNYVRFAVFGGVDASHEEAGKEVREYIKDWEEA